jgi:hypothetical protein
MTGEDEAKEPQDTFEPEEGAPEKDRSFADLGELERRFMVEWTGQHLPELRRSVYGQRILYWTSR